MELIVWPGGWDLPSIDPECMAAISYILSTEPANSKAARIVISNDPLISPNGTFPILRCTHGSPTTTSGFTAIVQHLRSCPVVSHHPESHLAPSQLADITAWIHFIRTNAQQLLDLYLYISSENYYASTRPTWAALLPWYSKLIIPPAERKRAKDRTAHLGMSGLDLGDVEKLRAEGGAESMANQAGSSSSTAMVLQQQRRLRNLLRQPEYVDSFRLNALIDQFCTPLVEHIGNGKWLVTEDEPSSVDFLAVAYLLVILRADMPKRWLSNAIENKYPSLKGYAERVEEMMSRRLNSMHFKSPSTPTLLHGLSFLGRHLLSSIPLFDRPEISRMPGTVAAFERQQNSKTIFERYNVFQNSAMSVGALGITGLTVLGYFRWHTKREGNFIIRSIPKAPRFADFGEAGEFLSVFAGQWSDGMGNLA